MKHNYRVTFSGLVSGDGWAYRRIDFESNYFAITAENAVRLATKEFPDLKATPLVYVLCPIDSPECVQRRIKTRNGMVMAVKTY